MLGAQCNIKLSLKFRPTGWIRRSNPRVKTKCLVGQRPPTCVKSMSHGLIGRWRVGSVRVRRLRKITRRIESGQYIYKPHGGSGRVRLTHFESRGLGRVGSKGIQIIEGAVWSSQHTATFRGWGRVSRFDPTRPVGFNVAR